MSSGLEQELIDWIIRGCPSPAPPVTKSRIVTDFVRRSGCKYFVESGTFTAATSGMVSQIPNVEIHTMELSKMYHAKAVELFKDRPDIHCWQGDSIHVIPKVLDHIHGPALFWLDGHYSGGDTALGEKACPTLEELFHIFLRPNPGHVVLIDDMRDFTGGIYPHADLVADIAKHYWPEYTVTNVADIMRILPPGFPLD
jgi:hypothetical protein